MFSISHEPPIKVPIANTPQSEQGSQGNGLAQIESRLPVFLNVEQLLINAKEQFHDKFFGGHDLR
jgi:hypothetical protein